MTDKTDFSPSLSPALFLDRDGILNQDCAYPYLPEHIVWQTEWCSIFAKLQKKYHQVFGRELPICVLTNQSGIARQKFQQLDVDNLHHWMSKELQNKFSLSIPFNQFYIAPSLDPLNPLRKPNPGMLIQAIKDHQLDAEHSLMLGDKTSDQLNYEGPSYLLTPGHYPLLPEKIKKGTMIIHSPEVFFKFALSFFKLI